MRGATRARTSVGEFRESTNVLCWGGKKIIFFAKKDPASVARFLKIFCISNGVLIIRHYINCLCNWCQHGNEGANGKFSRLIFVRRGIISSLKYIRLYCIAAARRRHERYTIDRSTKVHAWLQNRKRERERERARKRERKMCQRRREAHRPRRRHRANVKITWKVSIQGHARVQFEYVSCPPDIWWYLAAGEWTWMVKHGRRLE